MNVLIFTLASALFCLQLVSTQQNPKIYYLHIRSDIKYRFSTTLVTSKVVNSDTRSRETTFDVTLPNEAFISKFKLMIYNRTYDGIVKEKEEAKQQYEAAKELGQSAGHIVAKPRETNKFQIMINVAAAEKVTFELTYQEVLRRVNGHYSHVTYIDPGDVVQDMTIEVAITESRDLTTLRVPPIRSDILTDVNIEQNNALAVIERPSPKTAYIKYNPSTDQQQRESDSGLKGQFIVQYDIDRQNNAGELMVVNGYFVHYFAPDGLSPLPMDVVFILDKSGSMAGRKIEQLREAMRKILREMSDDDRFTIMTFDSKIGYWKRSLVEVSDRSLLEANDFVDKIQARGSTNIVEALGRGLDMITSAPESSRAPVVIFLTDGQPTTGETRTDRILSLVKEKNTVDVPIFSLAFGSGADYQFTKKLAAQNNGLGRKIYEDSDSALQISGLYKEISTVLLKDITFRYLDANVNQSSLTKTNFNTFFGGKEIMVCGSFIDDTPSPAITPDLTPVVAPEPMPLEVTGRGVNGTTITLVLPDTIDIALPYDNGDPRSDVTLNLTNKGDFSEITEKLWAYLTIKQLLQEKDAVTVRARLQDLDQQILQLSLKYQFVTPLTSMVVTLPDVLKATPRLVTDEMENDVSGSAMDLSSISHSSTSSGRFPLTSKIVSSLPNIVRSRPRLTSIARLPSRLYANFNPRRPISSIASSLLPSRNKQKSSGILKVQKSKRRRWPNTGRKAKRRRKPKRPRKPKTQKKSKVPSLLVKLKGLTLPLCMDLVLDKGQYILLNVSSPNTQQGDMLTTVEVALSKARSVFTAVDHHTSEVPMVPSNVSHHIPPLIDEDQINVNSNRRNGTNTVQVYVELPAKQQGAFFGILEKFNGMTGKLIKQKVRRMKIFGKIKIRKGSQKTKLRGVQLQNPYPGLSACWYLSSASLGKLKLGKAEMNKYMV